MKVTRNLLKNSSTLYYLYFRVNFLLKYEIPARIMGDRFYVVKKYTKRFGFAPNLKAPIRLTEKMQVLKLKDHNDVYTLYADKYRVREFIGATFGEDILIPLVYDTANWRNLRPENLPNTPCVIKANTGCGTYQIIKDMSKVNWNLLRGKARVWVTNNHYYKSQEWQYKNIKPHYIVEQLLQPKDGFFPNDYKLFYVGGELQFIHVSVNGDRTNRYKIEYDPEWKPLNFSWEKRITSGEYHRGKEVPRPETFERMKEIGSVIAKDMPQVRVDFYDVDGKLYFGEITMCHGSGMNIFIPDEYDIYFGAKLTLPAY
ncbi:MAG: hypothetical protein E7106_00595 [Prevotella sp.]|nr:hypothetical protein [Prevotella sp.]